MTQHARRGQEHGIGYEVDTVLARVGAEVEQEQVDYLVDMANRLGFEILPVLDSDPGEIRRIRINIGMRANEFIVTLREVSRDSSCSRRQRL